MKPRLQPEEYIQGILQGDRLILSRAITLIESNLPHDQLMAEQILNAVLPYTGKSWRIGITGVPGVGKSTFIETFGLYLIEQTKQPIAILAIDPSSRQTKGSILGDKTRMQVLSRHKKAYIRPTATGNSLGGVAQKSREAMLLCEAAGFEIILIETVGVGQSEVAVRDMCDFFLLLMLAGAGDELQGIKRGIMEMANMIAITKSDENPQRALVAKSNYENALHFLAHIYKNNPPQVVVCSALQPTGIDVIFQYISDFFSRQNQAHILNQREEQYKKWLHEIIQQELLQQFYNHPQVKQTLSTIEQQIVLQKIAPRIAAQQLIKLSKI
jgi:LAO/AO transport system kinase